MSRENVIYAFYLLKGNEGSKTPGCDNSTIKDLEQLDINVIHEEVLRRLSNYRPSKVRRVYIPKKNGKKRPLGIPSIWDRLIQQCFLNILQPICEGRFFEHSYGFRPNRNAHHALRRVEDLINVGKNYYAVDVDIEGFFDNINHNKLIRQLWNIGIRDRRVITIISKMLKAPIEGEGIQTKGTPQGGILSPLLANVVLNDLDHWISSQWENFDNGVSYARKRTMWVRLRKKTKLKEGYIVRYADDFKILCKSYDCAIRWRYAVEGYIKNTLRLNVSEEKTKVTDLRKHDSEFLGFSIKVRDKGNKLSAKVNMSKESKNKVVEQLKKQLKEIRYCPTERMANQYNMMVLGYHNYYRYASQIYADMKEIGHRTAYTRKMRLKQHEHDFPKKKEVSKVYLVNYTLNRKSYKISNVWLLPIEDCSWKLIPGYKQDISIYKEESRVKIFSHVNYIMQNNVAHMMGEGFDERKTVEFMNSKISRYMAQKGKCDVTGEFIEETSEIHAHHVKPFSLGGGHEYNNIRIVSKCVHQLIHATKSETIMRLLSQLNLNNDGIKKVNKYRKACKLNLI